MTDGQIWAIMLRKRIFTAFDILNEINPSSYIRPYIKERVRSIITGQIKTGALKIIEPSIPVLAVPDVSDYEIDNYKAICPVCGQKFFRKNSQEKYCSESCKGKVAYIQQKEKKKQYLRKRKDLSRKAAKRYTEKLQSATGTKGQKRWEQWEIELLQKLGKLTKKQMVEVANQLGRSYKSVENKYYQLRKEALV